MMIARMQQVPQWRFWVVVGLMTTLPTLSFAQGGYNNPSYHPKKGQTAEVPSYSSPSQSAEAQSHTTSNGSHQSMRLGINLQLPVAIGDAGQGLKPKFGGSAAMYLTPMFDDSIDNYLSVGLDLLTLKSDSNSTFRVIPFVFGLELPAQEGKTFSPIFGVALGGAYAWISVPDSQSFSGKMYFLAQLKPGVNIDLDGFSLVLQTPISFLIGTNKMSYLAYSVGARFGL